MRTAKGMNDKETDVERNSLSYSLNIICLIITIAVW